MTDVYFRRSFMTLHYFVIPLMLLTGRCIVHTSVGSFQEL